MPVFKLSLNFKWSKTMARSCAYVVIDDNPPFHSTSGPYKRSKIPEMVLICYDTLAVEKINQRRDFHGLPEELKFKCPAKYALALSEGGEDASIFCQVHAHPGEFQKAAVWFDCFWHLPQAIEILKGRHPVNSISSGVSAVLDWPVSDEKMIKSSVVEV